MIQKQKAADVMTDHLCCVKQFELCTTTAKMTPEGDLFPPEEASKGAPSQLPVLPPHPAPPPSGSQRSLRQTERDRQRESMLPDTLTALHSEAPSRPETQYVCLLKSSTIYCCGIALWEAAGETEQILEEYRSVCWFDSRRVDYTAQLKEKKNCSYPLVEWMRITPRGSR